MKRDWVWDDHCAYGRSELDIPLCICVNPLDDEKDRANKAEYNPLVSIAPSLEFMRGALRDNPLNSC